jgi:hypothetical protein
MLPGSEASKGQRSGTSPLEDGAEVWPDEERLRQERRQSEREAEHGPAATRVRFEFAGRAHQRSALRS